MKVIQLHKNETKLIQRAAKNNREAQHVLYELHAPKMLSVCRQYVKDAHFAEDVMVTAFVKVFKGLQSFEFKGSFEGWVRRIMVRESITYLRKKQFVVYDDEVFEKQQPSYHSNTELDVEYVQQLIDALPEGYKMVFVLYAVEGYKHQEIAELLDITVGTSKSQLSKARKQLQENLKLQKEFDNRTMQR